MQHFPLLTRMGKSILKSSSTKRHLKLKRKTSVYKRDGRILRVISHDDDADYPRGEVELHISYEMNRFIDLKGKFASLRRNNEINLLSKFPIFESSSDGVKDKVDEIARKYFQHNIFKSLGKQYFPSSPDSIAVQCPMKSHLKKNRKVFAEVSDRLAPITLVTSLKEHTQNDNAKNWDLDKMLNRPSENKEFSYQYDRYR